MAYTVVDLTCPGCGGAVDTSMAECSWCHRPVIISTFNSVANMSTLEVNKYASTYRKALAQDPDNTALNKSVAMCYLKLRLYDKALAAFEKAIEDNFDDSEVYFYAGICLLNGKKAFLHMRPTIDKILEYIDAANMIEPKGIYYYFLAYIKYDYFERKRLNTSPNYVEALQTAFQAGLSKFDVQQFHEILGIEMPDWTF